MDLDADLGPNLMNPMNLKFPLQTSFRLAPPLPTLGLPNQMKADAATEANESKAGPKGLDFKCIRIVIFGPGSACNEANVGPTARTFDA